MRGVVLALLFAWVAGLVGAGAVSGAGAQTPPAADRPMPVPVLDRRVMDLAGLLSPADAQALENRLAELESRRGSQVVVLVVRSTRPEDIAAFAQRMGDAWKIGRREVGDGVLIVVATDDRRLNIQVAKALEGAIPDLAARQIIDRSIAPAFRAGEPLAGLIAAADAIEARIAPEGLPVPGSPSGARSGTTGGLEEALGLLFMAVPILGAVTVTLFGRRLGALVSGAGAGGLGWWVSGSLGLAAVAAAAAFVLVGLFGAGLGRRMASAGRGAGPLGRGGVRAGPVIWGGGVGHGGWGGGGGGSWGGGGGGGGGFGGFGSGGGGNFGGGGASGGW